MLGPWAQLQAKTGECPPRMSLVVRVTGVCQMRALCVPAQWAQLEAATDEYIVRVDAQLAAAAALLVSGRDAPALEAATLSLGAT